MTFDVQDEGRLAFMHTETNLHKDTRVIANDGSNSVLDPDPQKVNPVWRIWIIKRRPISRCLESWRSVLESVGSSSGKTCAFFQYSMKMVGKY